VGGRRVISGIIHVIRNGLMWRDAPVLYCANKALYNGFVRWSALGGFNRFSEELAAMSSSTGIVMIDPTHLKAHRTAASLLKNGAFPAVSGGQRAG
jgi:transposase